MDLDQDTHDYFYYQYLIFYLIGFMFLISANGQVTIKYYERPDSYVPYEIREEFDNYIVELTDQQRNIKIINIILYLIISPFVTFYYTYVWFKKGIIKLPKFLNNTSSL